MVNLLRIRGYRILRLLLLTVVVGDGVSTKRDDDVGTTEDFPLRPNSKRLVFTASSIFDT